MSPASPRYFCFLNAITAVITGRNHLHTWGSLNRYTLWIVPFLLYVLLQTTFSVEAMANENGSVDGGTTKVQVQETYGKLPLYFIQNNGQVDEKVKFYEKGSGHVTYFTKEGVYISLVIK